MQAARSAARSERKPSGAQRGVAERRSAGQASEIQRIDPVSRVSALACAAISLFASTLNMR